MAGREEIRRTLAPLWERAGRARRVLAHEPIAVHSGRDSEVVIVEFDVKGETEGSPYRLSYVHVVRARGGLIVSLRDYFDSALLAARIREDAHIGRA